MSIVQLQAPPESRGRVIGSYSAFGPGMRTFSGVIVGILGSLLGISGSVLVGGLALTAATVVTLGLIRPPLQRS